MPAPPECAFPSLAPTTGYTRGCRCERCVDAARAAKRRSRERHAGTLPRPDDGREEDWYSSHRDKLRAAYVEGGKVPDADTMTLALRKDIAPRLVRGRYTEAEDRVIIAWRDTDLMLAVALGRTYNAVISRKHRLRLAGRLWA